MRERCHQTLQVLAWFSRADEQKVIVRQPVQVANTSDFSVIGPFGFYAQWYQAQPLGRDAGDDTFVHCCLAAAQHQVRPTLDDLKAAAKDPHPVASELAGVVKERKVVQGDNQFGIGGARDQRCGVGDIHLASGHLHLGPLAVEP